MRAESDDLTCSRSLAFSSLSKHNLMRALFLLIALVGLMSSCEDAPRDMQLPKVLLASRTDTSSVWLVYGTDRPDTCFVDIFPTIEHVGSHYIGYGHGYVPVYKCVYRHGQDSK
jgi:hypothetical protein